MGISQTAEHAIRAVLFLARQPEGARVPAQAIAEALDAPRNYLSKTLGVLAREGLIDAMRGPTGGFRLDRSPGEVSLAAVVELFEEPRGDRVCMEGGRPCDGAHPCGAHGAWSAVRAAARAPLEDTTIEDLLAGEGEAVRREGVAA